ncbi:hypothetical protein [Pseudomonas sp. St29]|uniref:hypothetical protein n=1 Tax=Pseudomonas sp. St29 TaxID=1500687 RepID=UPI0005FC64F4|nr:hypothetical protein [Pseudomonas sp. St29]BAQ79147.1 uncharacterized protein PST29_1258 [Pseudomonas sp. St29]
MSGTIDWTKVITQDQKQVPVEDAWREGELMMIINQLQALEEADSGAEPRDLLPGTRKQWLAYRGQVRSWCQGNDDFPDIRKRPARPE